MGREGRRGGEGSGGSISSPCRSESEGVWGLLSWVSALWLVSHCLVIKHGRCHCSWAAQVTRLRGHASGPP